MNRFITIVCGCAVLAPVVALAQDAPDAEPATRFEVTPFVGYRFGGDFESEDTGEDLDVDEHGSFAVALDLRRDPWSQYELFYSRQATQLQGFDADIDIEYLHLGGTLLLNDDYPLKPYLVATLGVTRFSPSPAEADDDTRLSFSVGTGVRVPVSEHFSLRFEARGYLTFVDTDTAVFCSSGVQGGICAIHANGSTFLQFDLLAGAAFAF